MPQKTYGVIVVAWINLLEYVYPIGSVYFSINDISPSQTIGGTWSKLTGGCLGLADSDGFANAGSNGGSRTISITQMPSHNHLIKGWNIGNAPAQPSTVPYNWIGYSGSSWQSADDMMTMTGGGQDYIPAHSSVYAWIRIS